jgi:hypothetical protein
MGTESEQLEQEARQSRAHLSQITNALRDRMTPGDIVDQVAEYAQRGPAAEFLRNLGREARENPLPLTLIATGVAWLIIATSLSSRARLSCAAEKPESFIERRDEIGAIAVPSTDRAEWREAGLQEAPALEPAHEA